MHYFVAAESVGSRSYERLSSLAVIVNSAEARRDVR